VHRRQAAVLLLAPLGACSLREPRTLPPLPVPDEVLVQRNGVLLSPIKDPTQLAAIASFVNGRLTGWSAPWYGAPVGQVYFIFKVASRVVGNFYVGPWFFGRDHGDFLSQSASRAEVAELGRLAHLPLIEYVEAESKR
jgi:hypothetical protein